MTQWKTLVDKTVDVLKRDGIKGVQKHAKHYLQVQKENKKKVQGFKDVLFINGCARSLLPQSVRYRVDHQIEQLESFGLSCDEVFYKNIKEDQIGMYRNIILFRCVCTPELERFVYRARQMNKKVYYDVDDLVIDTCYTNQIPSLSSLTKEERKQYDEDVISRQKILRQCDGAITTTTRMAQELLHYVGEVFINANAASQEMVLLSKNVTKERSNIVKVGYFSGSSTHNDDLQMILPALERALKLYENMELYLVGALDVPSSLKLFKDRVHIEALVDYRELPQKISSMDVNLAPLCDTVFNEAKSEIKWMEAALVKTCTIASNVGAFKENIQDHETGLLCGSVEEWNQAFDEVIQNESLRLHLAQNAYNVVMDNYCTIYNGNKLATYIKENQRSNIFFAMPKVEISGGIMVVLRHMCMLQSAGYDVSVLSLYDEDAWTTYEGYSFPIVKMDDISGRIDHCVATMWPTVEMISKISTISKRSYLVQNFETDFYDFNDPLKKKANQSYSPKVNFQFLTISKWCQSWLNDRYGQLAYYAPNGIDFHRFKGNKRKLVGKIRILIEGDCQAKHKNVDESFRIVEKLDPERFEIWYMSYNAKPKDWYRVDRFFHRIPYDQVPSIYQQCDILIKTSLLESFSYPPLEMMASGGYVLAIQNDGNKEYLVDEENAMIYPQGQIDLAVQKIHELIKDESLQEQLYENGLQCAKQRDWANITSSILKMYEK